MIKQILLAASQAANSGTSQPSPPPMMKFIMTLSGISGHTVKFHVTSIYNKLGVSNWAEAVRLGIQLGLVIL